MSKVGQRERETQNRIVQLFSNELRYHYLGNWEDRENRNIETSLLQTWLTKQEYSHALITRALHELTKAAALGEGKSLYDANKEVYRLLRYGIKVKEGAGEQYQTVWLIDWSNPDANDFAFAEEVTVKGNNTKRPDIVLYINGIGLGVIELKRSYVDVSEGIRQNLDNQKKGFIRNFFTTMQLVMAGNDTQGMRYGTIETPEKYYLEWKEKGEQQYPHKLDSDISRVCRKDRFLQIIHDFIVFDAGVKKTCRHNQFFGVQAAKEHIEKHQGGIIWHTQGSGKSLTMVWLAKWIRENVTNSRVLIITDRTELDEQIEGVFYGIDEEIHRTKSGVDLVATLNQANPWLLCTLVHKFGRQQDNDDEESTNDFLNAIRNALPDDFKPKGNLFVFVDECHRTQSGKLHQAMKAILPEAMFIGFTGTPLMKKDKARSVEVFGPYIHTYKFDEAVADGVVLDLRYEARDIDQQITSDKKVDQWFESKTQGMSNIAKTQLKQKWGSMQKLLSSRSRLEQIYSDILMDMDSKPRLREGRGNAMLVCASVHQACTIYEMFSRSELAGKCAIVTSYQPTAASIKGESTGEGDTEKLFKYSVYRKMLAEYFDKTEDEAANLVEEFEKQVKRKFVKEPGQMRLLIVVDKLLTGFDAPPATYLYIDKQMADHNLFQAICRVNRLDGEDKDVGYIVDYKDLFRSLDKAISDYTGEAFDSFDKDDVEGLLKDRLKEAREDLETTLEMVKGLCEPVKAPKETHNYLNYFCGQSGENEDELFEKENLRLTLYKSVAKLIRVYGNLANEMAQAGFSAQQAEQIRREILHFENARDEIKKASGDNVDMKRFEPAMRFLLDTYVRAEPSEQLVDIDDLGLVDLIVKKGANALDALPDSIRNRPENMAETIENNVRRTIVDENPVNPKYYERMSTLLAELIHLRKQRAIEYQEYLEKMIELARKVKQPSGADEQYPSSMDSQAKRAFYDNFGQNEELASILDKTIRETKKADWVGDRFKEREVARAVAEQTAKYEVKVTEVIELAKKQQDYR